MRGTTPATPFVHGLASGVIIDLTINMSRSTLVAMQRRKTSAASSNRGRFTMSKTNFQESLIVRGSGVDLIELCLRFYFFALYDDRTTIKAGRTDSCCVV
jgi:hypothetical protein